MTDETWSQEEETEEVGQTPTETPSGDTDASPVSTPEEETPASPSTDNGEELGQ